MKLAKLPEGPEFTSWVAYRRDGLEIRHVSRNGVFYGEHFAVEYRDPPGGHLVSIKEIWLTAEEFLDAAARLAHIPYDEALPIMKAVAYGTKPSKPAKASRKKG